MTGKRIFYFVSKLSYTSKETIEKGLAHKSIKQYAYILHDKDVYTQQDEKSNKNAKAGELKDPHWHVVLQFKDAVKPEVVAKWFNLDVHMLQFPHGQGAFLDGVEYLTHEDAKQQALQKYLYPDEEVIANFDFRKELKEREANEVKYGRNLSAKERQRYAVLYEGKTLRQCISDSRVMYMDDIDKLKKFRMEYISNQKPPKTRFNYYICGRGGLGKGLISRAIARSLYPDLTEDDDIFFEVGAKGVAFDGYDGQPVIIWNDRRAIDLLQELDGRGNVFNVFDTHPTKQRQNVKYSSVNLCNTVNIVNSVEPLFDFLNGLAGEYTSKGGKQIKSEDKGQSYRRFPFLIPLHEDDFDMLLNKGFVENTNNFEEYIQYNHIRGNMQKIAEKCGSNEELARRLETQTVSPITYKHNEVLKKFSKDAVDEEAILAEFADYGKIIPPVPKIEEKKPVVDYFGMF